MNTDATMELWSRIERPFDPVGAVEAVTGLHPAAARAIVGLHVATSPEADELLDRMHDIVRSLAVASTSEPVRSVGEIRGPVLWAETIAARGSSPGAADVVVCASTAKAYDTDENRVLVHALSLIRHAAHAVDPSGHTGHDELRRRARRCGGRAIRALEHRTLATVRAVRPSGRAVQKARSGMRARQYGPAIELLDRAADPVDAIAVAAVSGDRVRRRHGLLLALADRLGIQRFRVHGGTLRAERVRAVPDHRAEPGFPAGILLGDLVLDVPATAGGDALEDERRLRERSEGHPVLVVAGPRDLERALRLSSA